MPGSGRRPAGGRAGHGLPPAPGLLPAALLAAFAACAALPPPADAQAAQPGAAASAASKAAGQAVKPYVVAVAELSGRDLGSLSEPFLSILPRLLAAELSSLPPRHEDGAYLAEAALRSSEAARFAAGAALAARLDEEALRSLEPGVDPLKRASQVAEARRRTEEAAKALAELGSLGEAAAPPAASRASAQAEGAAPPASGSMPQAGTGPRTTLLWEGNAGGGLFPATESDPSSLLRDKGVSLLVRGQARAFGSYLALDMECFDLALGRPILAFRAYADPADPGSLARDIAARVERAVAGRDFARVELKARPASALVLADGGLLGTGDGVLYRFEPGILELAAAAPGRLPESLSLPLGLGDRKTASFDLKRASTGLVLVETDPPGAAVFLDGLPAGKAPARLELEGRRAVASASAPGRESVSVVLQAEGESVARIELPPDDGLGPAGRIDLAQRRFYKALGWFVLSLPATTLGYGIQGSYREAAARGYDPGMVSAYETSYYAFEIAAAASAALAVNALFRLAAYIRAAR
ncbi:MAG TPA: hypothetical protein PLG14_10195 [Spirochaetales bacterium]|nr:hypothetical protein [Spirochaetales bacterium]